MAHDAITIVDASESHFAAILRIDRADREAGGGSVVGLLGEEALHAALARGHWIVIAAIDEQVVGWIWFTIELENGENVGHIYQISVVPDRRFHGIGRTLMRHARTLFEARGCSSMTLDVDPDLEGSQAFFERVGFSVFSVNMWKPL
jgi:ribosomal protein S18 acetylase RimI-like enzyme